MGRKLIAFSAAALALGFIVGVVCSSTVLSPFSTPLGARPSATPVPTPGAPVLSSAPQDAASLDTGDNALLVQRAGEVLQAIKGEDFAALAACVHPTYGVQFTPYSTVQPEVDLRLSTEQIAGLGDDPTLYTWGSADGSGDPIRLSGRDYFARYVFNVDYTRAPVIGVDTVLESGNALENVADSFPGCRFVEFHFPGIDPKNQGFDWCSLKLVFSPCQDRWQLVALIHSEWTI